MDGSSSKKTFKKIDQSWKIMVRDYETETGKVFPHKQRV